MMYLSFFAHSISGGVVWTTTWDYKLPPTKYKGQIRVHITKARSEYKAQIRVGPDWKQKVSQGQIGMIFWRIVEAKEAGILNRNFVIKCK